MRALVFHEHGGPEVLHYGEVPDPGAGPGEVVVRVRAAALNHLDLWVRRGWPGLRLVMPHVGGADGAGEVHAVGEGVEGVEVGMRVAICPGFQTREAEFVRRGDHSMSPGYRILGESWPGVFGEFARVPAHAVLPMPESADYALTAAAQLVFLTAWRLLMTRGRLRAGETVLLVGTGGVNTAALQIAALSGARTFVLTGSVEKGDRARELGAEEVLASGREDWDEAVRELTGRRGVDVVVDNVGRATFGRSLSALRRGGRLLTVGNTSGPKAEVDIRYLFFKQLQVIGSTVGTPEEFREVMGLVWAGRLQPAIDRTLPLSQGREAHRLMEERRVFGKIVLELP